MWNPCREKEHRHGMWSDSRAGHRLAKDRGQRVCTWVPIALYTAEWGTEMAGSICAQGRCSWGALIFINNWGNGLFLSGENSVYLLIDPYWRTGWPDVYIQVRQTSSKGYIGIHHEETGYLVPPIDPPCHMLYGPADWEVHLTPQYVEKPCTRMRFLNLRVFILLSGLCTLPLGWKR